MTDSTAKVTVILVTYNHERFVQQALDSVLMQETGFPVDVVVLEDCSTDRTREILIAYQRAHPTRIRLVLAEFNRCDNLAIMNAIQACTSPFVALLDGDDYWTSPHKLRRQVDYLEREPGCALSYHNALLVYDDSAREPRPALAADQKATSTLVDLLESCFVPTCSAMFNRRCLDDLPASYVDDQCGDWSLFLHAAQHGHLGYQSDVMAVYRQHSGGFWVGQGRLAQLERVIQFYELLLNRLPLQYSSRIRTLLARQCHELALEHAQTGQHEAAQRRLRDCLAAEPDTRRVLWSLRVAAGNVAELEFPPGHPDTVRVIIGKAAAANFDIQLNLPLIPVRAGHRYAVEFRARADRTRTLYAGFAQAHEPWAGLGLHQRVELGTEWQSFVEPFVALAGEANGRIHFDAGESPVCFEVAGVRLRSLPDGGVIEPGLLSLGAA